jgi:hypothetical protein
MLYLTGSEHGKILEHYNIMMCCDKVYVEEMSHAGKMWCEVGVFPEMEL